MNHPEELFSPIPPERLFGRETDLGVVLESVERAARGNCGLLLISGETGMGKTTLARAVQHAMEPVAGYFISGKFHQFPGQRPLAAFQEALAELARTLAAETPDQRAHWRSQISDRLGSNVATLVDLVPDMEALCGEQPHPVEVTPLAARTRIASVIVDTLSLITESNNTLVVFLDDLHWGDPATVAVLERVMQRGVPRLLMIAAYRTDEPDVESALASLTASHEAGHWPDNAQVSHLLLRALTTFDIQSVLRAKLGGKRLHDRELAAQCQLHCDGNPFKLQQFLLALHARKLLRFDEKQGGWTWDLTGIRRLPRSTDITDLIRLRLEALPLPVLHTLAVAACLGRRFRLADVATLTRMPLDTVRDATQTAVLQGFVEIQMLQGRLGESGMEEIAVFQHDQVERAAYGLQDQAVRLEVHIRIGWLLADRKRPADTLDAAGHLYRARSLLEKHPEREAASLVMLRASGVARRLTAWKRMYLYSKSGLELLGDAAWEDHRILAFALARNVLESAHYAETDADADADADLDALLARLMQHNLLPIQRAELLWIRCAQHLAQANLKQSEQTGYQALQICIPGLPDFGQVTSADFAQLDREVELQLRARSKDWLSNLQITNDEMTRFAFQILPEFVASTYLSGNQLLRGYICLTAMKLMLIEGRVTGNYFPLCAYVFFLGISHRIDQAGQLALEAISRPDYAIEDRAHTCSNLAIVLRALHYRRPFSECAELLEHSSPAAHRIGNLVVALSSLGNATLLHLTSGAPLQTSADRILQCQLQADAARLPFLSLTFEIFGRHTRALQASPAKIPLQKVFQLDEGAVQAMNPVLGDWIEQFRLHIAFWRAENQAIAELLEAARRHASTLRGTPQMIEFHFMEVYCLLHGLAPCEDEDRGERVQAAASLIARAAAGCPANYAHLHSLVDAELAWLRDDDDLALMLYRAASREAGLYRNLPYQAFAEERLAHLLDARGASQEAAATLQGAASHYRAWGCHHRAGQLRL